MSIKRSDYHWVSDATCQKWSKASCGAVNSWWWIGLPGEVAAEGNFICSLIVFIFMGYRGALWGEWPLKMPCKYFYFTTGGGWNAWNG